MNSASSDARGGQPADSVEEPPTVSPPPSQTLRDADELPAPPFDQPKTVELRLEDARAAALQNNLDLQVQFVAPAISQEQVWQEVAQFQSMLNAAFGRNHIDPPPGNFLFGAQQPEVVDGFNPYSRFSFINPALTAIDVPLTTGGRFSVEAGLARLETEGIDSTYDTSLGFSFSQPLLRGAGRNVNTAPIRIAELNSGTVNARTKLAVIRVLAEVERAYWELYRADMVREVARQQLEIANSQLRVADRMIEADLISQVDRLRAESGLHSREVAAIASRTDVLIATRELKRILQRADLPVDVTAPIAIATDPLPLGLRLDRDILTHRAIADRSDLFEIELQILANAIEISVEENAVLPRFDVVARYALLGSEGTLGTSYDRLFGDGFNDWFVGVVGQVPLPVGSCNQAADARRRRAVLRNLQNSIARQNLEVISARKCKTRSIASNRTGSGFWPLDKPFRRLRKRTGPSSGCLNRGSATVPMYCSPPSVSQPFRLTRSTRWSTSS